MGNVYDHPTMEDLSNPMHGNASTSLKNQRISRCGKCAHIKYCRGGCPYNAIVPTGGEMSGIDPYCTAYRMIFNKMTKRFNDENVRFLWDGHFFATNNELFQTRHNVPHAQEDLKCPVMIQHLKSIKPIGCVYATVSLKKIRHPFKHRAHEIVLKVKGSGQAAIRSSLKCNMQFFVPKRGLTLRTHRRSSGKGYVSCKKTLLQLSFLFSLFINASKGF